MLTSTHLKNGVLRVPALVFLASALLLGSGCSSGGGGGGGSFSSHGTLLSVKFPDPSAQNVEPVNQPPSNASLIQQVVFTFDSRPNPGQVSATTIRVRDLANVPVPGQYVVKGTVVTFTPSLPTRPTSVVGGIVDPGGSGLLPGQSYTVEVGPLFWSFVGAVDPELRAAYPNPADPKGMRMVFASTTNPAAYFTGLPARAPKLVSSSPADGSSDISPNLYTDPDKRFPTRRSYVLEFDAPVNPQAANVGDQTFALIDLDDRPSLFPRGLPLGVYVEVLENTVSGAKIGIDPSGILPFGHLLALEYPETLRGIAEGGIAGSTRSVAASFTIAELAAGSPSTIRDILAEDFDTTDRKGPDAELELGTIPAEWDRLGSNMVQAAVAFEGAGELGPFVPPAPPDPSSPVTIQLDTSTQVFPLFDGSTPEAPSGYTVLGGKFPFTDIDIPEGVVLRPIGPNPLVLLATGTVRIAGEIRADGGDGVNDGAFDSAVASTPGGISGSGGGRGGVGHPIVFYPVTSVNPLTMVSPFAGGRGWGPGNLAQTGGFGGETGIMDNQPVGNRNELHSTCLEFQPEHANAGKIPGGGGGSFFEFGEVGKDGIGNVRPDGKGGYIIPPREDPRTLFGGQPGATPFPDLNPDNNFLGIGGELQFLIGGQGGGGGGTRMESYYCGAWCLLDSDPTNDNLCIGGEFPLGAPNGQNASASVGDARGGGGGGGAGGIWIRAMGPIEVFSTSVISAVGGAGGGGETLGCSNWGGSGGGGTGGSVVLESAESVYVQNGALVDVRGGLGKRAEIDDRRLTGCNPPEGSFGEGGDGSPGIIQLQVPFDSVAEVEKRQSIKPIRSWSDKMNLLNPSAFSSVSTALSTWFDMGRVIAMSDSPVFRFKIAGIELGFGNDGLIRTDSEGFVVKPGETDLRADYLGQTDPQTGAYLEGQEPHEDFIPKNATIKVEFQGASSVVEGSKEVDPDSLTDWVTTPVIAQDRQFIRYRITFDIAAPVDLSLQPNLPRPTVQAIGITAEFEGR